MTSVPKGKSIWSKQTVGFVSLDSICAITTFWAYSWLFISCCLRADRSSLLRKSEKKNSLRGDGQAST